MKEKIVEILKKHGVKPDDSLVDDIAWFIGRERFDAHHQGMMDAIKKVEERFGLKGEGDD